MTGDGGAGRAPLHHRISFSGFSTPDWSLEDDLDYARARGVGQIGIPAGKLLAAGWQAGATAVRRAGVRVSCIADRSVLRLDDPATWPSCHDHVSAMITAAVEVGAPCVVLTSGTAGQLTWEAAADATTRAWSEVCARADSLGVTVAFEPVNPLRTENGFISTLRDAIEIATELNAGVVVEPMYCWMERGLAATISQGVERIALVQVSDFRFGSLSLRSRCVPGDGDLPLARIFTILAAAGYPGAFEVEIYGPEIDREGSSAALTRSIHVVDRLLREEFKLDHDG